ncbi:MAG: DUF86 domain-containing protein [Deltaproteobacteria bacterium]|nr:DUF86 domain-containing protein [Deltaproteobacteria bacterium]
MNAKIHKYLLDILNACNDIESFATDLSRAQFEDSLLIQRAVEREFEIIGEALNASL